MPERGPAFVHHLGLALRVEVLGDLAHDPHDLPLPGLQQRRMFFDEVQDVFLRFGGEACIVPVAVLVCAFRNGAPQIVDLFLQMLLPVLLPTTFFLGGNRVGAFVAVNTVVHQRMTGVQQVLDRVDAMALFALHDVLLGEHQVINDRTGVGPGAEQVVAFEEAVVPVTSVGHHQRLHADGVFFHQVGDAGVGVDHDFVGQPHLPTGVGFFGAKEMFAVRPMVITQRHADGSVGVHHLFGRDHFDLVGVGVERIASRNTTDFAVVGLDQLERPFGAGGNGLAFLLFGGHVTNLRWKSSRKTG
ncbi:hypothetical protein PS676_05328 [Pseudomonas fluorescens]|nr:hypothetical protein PS676_05328 [Pseudomonas fluorescens]